MADDYKEAMSFGINGQCTYVFPAVVGTCTRAVQAQDQIQAWRGLVDTKSNYDLWEMSRFSFSVAPRISTML